MIHKYIVEQVTMPSDTDSKLNMAVWQITYSKNGAKERPIIIYNEENAYMIIQEFLRYKPKARVQFKKQGNILPVLLTGLEKRVDEYRAELEGKNRRRKSINSQIVQRTG